MNLNLRQAILDKVKNSTVEELEDIIQGSIGGEEVVLPGMGVIFEMLWQEINSVTKQELLQTLHKKLHAT